MLTNTSAQPLHLGDEPVSIEVGQVFVHDDVHSVAATHITRARRMTASDFLRISLATAKGSPC